MYSILFKISIYILNNIEHCILLGRFIYLENKCVIRRISKIKI